MAYRIHDSVSRGGWINRERVVVRGELWLQGLDKLADADLDTLWSEYQIAGAKLAGALGKWISGLVD